MARVLFATINHSGGPYNQDIKSKQDGYTHSFKKFPGSRIGLGGVPVLFPTHLPFRAEPIKLLIAKDGSSREGARPPALERRGINFPPVAAAAAEPPKQTPPASGGGWTTFSQ